MTVQELIAVLSSYDPDLPVIMAKDAEGNSFSPLSDVDFNPYCPLSKWEGEIGTSEDLAVFLWPMN